MSLQRDDLEKQCGCPAARWSKCSSHAWHLVGRHDGQRISKSVHTYAKRHGLALPTTRGEAEDIAERMIKDITAGTFDAPPPAVVAAAARVEALAAGLTFDQMWPAFVEAEVETREQIGPKTVKQFGSRFTRFARTVVPDVGRMGDQLVTVLTTPVVEALYKTATKGMANSTKHKYRQALTDLTGWLVETGRLETNPITKTTKLPAGPGAMRRRRVYPDEEANLLQAATETQAESGTRLVALLVLAFDCGLRHGELLALRWCDILWDEGPYGRVFVAALEEGARKGGEGEARRVPMTPRVRALLLELQTGPLGTTWPLASYVLGDAIGGRVTNVRKAWVTCVLRAHNHEPQWVKTAPRTRVSTATGQVIKDGSHRVLAPALRAVFAKIDLGLHDIRHERALRWLEAGTTLGTIAQLLGHHDLSTLRVYLGLAERDALREAEQVTDAAGDAPAVKVRTHAGRDVIVVAAPENDSKTTVKRPRGALRAVTRKEVVNG